jgi:hypothetical protein
LFQEVSKDLLLECLQTLEEEEEAPKVIMSDFVVKELPGKRRAKKSIDLINVKSLCRSTRLNKDLKGC